MERGLALVFVGINPGERSARLGHYYAGIGNQFWRLLHQSGLTDRELSFWEDRALLDYGFGLTDIVKRASRSSSQVTRDEFARGREELNRKLLKYEPRIVCFNGLTAFRAFFGNSGERKAGLRKESIGRCAVFLVPSSSARNGSYSFEEKLVLFKRLRRLRGRLEGSGPG